MTSSSLGASVRSLTDRSEKARGWLRATPEQCERLQRALCDARTVALARVTSDHMLPIRDEELLADPASKVDRIVEFLTLQVHAEQRQAAIALVQPIRRRY